MAKEPNYLTNENEYGMPMTRCMDCNSMQPTETIKWVERRYKGAMQSEAVCWVCEAIFIEKKQRRGKPPWPDYRRR